MTGLPGGNEKNLYGISRNLLLIEMKEKGSNYDFYRR